MCEHQHTHGHDHDHPHSHAHTHDPEEIRAIANRLARAIGHLESVRQMVLDGRDCSEVLVQLSAVRAALDRAGVMILKGHMAHCIVDAAQAGDTQAIADFCKALERYMR